MKRYVADRALPETAWLPGAGPRPKREVYACDRDGYLWGIDLFNHGFPWEAHEAWELEWAAGVGDRTRLQGLIQLAAAVVQSRLGHPRGVATLANRAANKLPDLADAITAWVDGGPLPVLTP